MTSGVILWRPQGGRRYPQMGYAGSGLLRHDFSGASATPVTPPDPGPYGLLPRIFTYGLLPPVVTYGLLPEED